MINDESLSFLKKGQKGPGYQHPFYQGYGFSCLTDTIGKLLLGEGPNALAPQAVGGHYERYDCVVLFLVDGFGWEFFNAYSKRYLALQRLIDQGVVSQISSEFPSTTASHLTTLHTGKEVSETGIYEWFQYEPLVDGMIAPLLFSYAGDHEMDGLVKEGYKATQVFPFETIYQKWARQGVRSFAFQPEKTAQAAYSQALLAGAEICSFTHFSQALDQIVDQLNHVRSQPTYFFVYFGEIDSAGHRHGLTSAQFSDAVDLFWIQIQENFWNKLNSLPRKTAILFTADHGMVPIDPTQTLFINEIYPDLPTYVKKNQQGHLLVPAGSCRDFFLHIEPPMLTQVKQELTLRLKGRADLFLTEQLIEEGVFGKEAVSARFKERVGNLVVLPKKAHNLFWRFDQHHFEQHFHAAHGGLTPEEMQSVFSFIVP